MESCKNCQFVFEGKFCPECGQKRYRAADKTIKSLLSDFITSLYNLDGPILHTIKTIYISPGKMTDEYNQGIRKRYFRPLSLYFILIVLYLLFPVAQGLNVSLEHHLSNNVAKNYAENTIQQYRDKHELSHEAFRERFANASASASKFLLILFIPFTILLFKFLFPIRRFYLYDVTIAATEVNILYLSLTFLLFPLLIVILYHTTGYHLGEILFTGIGMALFLWWSFLFFHRFFRQPWYLTLPKSLLFIVLHFLFMVMIYRFIVFQTTIWVM